jgi:sugar phosphate isomerase/epimerase
MIKPVATINLVPELSSGPFMFGGDLQESCENAAKFGFDAVEILPTSADNLQANELATLLKSNNLELAAIGTGAGFLRRQLYLCSEDSNIRTESIRFITNIIELAADFHAAVIIGCMQGRIEVGTERATAIAYLREGLNELGEKAAKNNVLLLIEPLNRYETNVLNRLDQGVELIQSLSTNNVKLLADLFHMNIEECSICDALQHAVDHIGHIHFVDSNRSAAGFGHIDFAAIAQTLQKINYDGYVSAEVLPYPNPQSAAEQTLRTFRKYFSVS